MQDPYSVLGISPSATDDEIKQAYRQLAKRYHPDVNNGSAEAESRMKSINEAYSVIMKMRRGGYTGTQGNWQDTGYSSGDPTLNAARTYIHARRFPEAINILNSIPNRTAEWYFLSALANNGIGNRLAALNDARQACMMDTQNEEYRLLLNQLQGGGTFYENMGSEFNFHKPTGVCSSPCLWCLLGNLFCNCCPGLYCCC